MAYQATSRANLRQTAWQVAGRVKAAEIAAGNNDPITIFELVSAIYRDLEQFHDSFSVQLISETTDAPPNYFGSDAPQPTAPESKTLVDPGTVVLNEKWKKHAGQTVSEVWAKDPSYVRWLASRDPKAYMTKIAKEFIAAAS